MRPVGVKHQYVTIVNMFILQHIYVTGDDGEATGNTAPTTFSLL